MKPFLKTQPTCSNVYLGFVAGASTELVSLAQWFQLLVNRPLLFPRPNLAPRYKVAIPVDEKFRERL